MKIIKCDNCNHIYQKPRIWPIKCSCGQNIQENGTYIIAEAPKIKIPEIKFDISKEHDYSCIYRKEKIGKIDCGCQGDSSVYQCEIFEYCSIRKLKPGLPIVELNDGSKTSDLNIKYCNLCEDRQEV